VNKLRKWISLIACLSLLSLMAAVVPAAADDVLTGIQVADTAERSSADHPYGSKGEAYPSDFDKYYVEGGEISAWLWNTSNASPAIFRFNLPDTATSFEPWFEGEDFQSHFTIYASNNKQDWLPVAGMKETYDKNKVYNSTSGLQVENGFDKATEGRAFDMYSSANAARVLENNPSKVVYLKILNIRYENPDQYGERIQLRSIGLTYSYTDGGADTDEDGTGLNVGVKIADTANRSVTEPLNNLGNGAQVADYSWDFDKFYESGGTSLSYLWNTTDGDPAVFKYNLPDTATTFEPWFEAKDFVGKFTVYASKTGEDESWLEVAKMTESYEQDVVYNSVGVVAQNYGTIPEGRGFGELNAENIAAILADNADKIVYLKIGDIVCDSPDAYGPRIQLRSFGLTYAYDASAANQGVQVADSANRADFEPNASGVNYWNNFYVSGGEATGWLWTTKNDSEAIFKFDLPDASTAFEPWFEGEDYVGTFKIYASKDGETNWLPVAEMTEAYEKNVVYNSTTGLKATDYGKETGGNAFSALNQENIAAILADNTDKIVYLKVSDIDSVEPDAYGDRIQLRSFGITYTYTGAEEEKPADPGEPSKPTYNPFTDPFDGDENYKLQNEFRIAVEGNTYDDGIPTYNESEFAEADQLGGIVQDGIRILKDKESVIYQIEVDPNAEFLKLDMWETALPEGESSYSQMFDIALYSSEAEEFKAIVDYGNNIPGGLTQEYFQWKYFDNTWGRSDTNKYIVTNDAPINPETGKKVLTLRFMARFQGDQGADNNAGQLFFKSFVVQTVVPVNPSSGEDDGNNPGGSAEYPVTVDTSKLDATLDVEGGKLILPREGITVKELTDALVIKEGELISFRFFDSEETEIFEEDVVLTAGMTMWVYHIDGQYEIYDIVIGGGDGGEESPETGYVGPIGAVAFAGLAAAALIAVRGRRKKNA